MAKAVVSEAKRRGLEVPDPQSFETIHGRGVIATVDDREVIVGNEALLEERAVLMSNRAADAGMSVQVAIDGRLIGSLQFLDETRPGAADVIRQLKATGIKRVVMLTGDNVDAARRVGQEIGIDDVRAQLLPQDKIAEIDELRRDGHVVAITCQRDVNSLWKSPRRVSRPATMVRPQWIRPVGSASHFASAPYSR